MASSDEKIGNAIVTLLGCAVLGVILMIVAIVGGGLTIWKVWHG